MSSKKKPVTLADKISSLVTAVPTTFGSDDEAEDTKAKVVDYDEELDESVDLTGYSTSSLRKQNLGLLQETDKRYKGKKVSSKQIFQQNDGSEYDEDSSSDHKDDDDDDDDDDSNENELDDSIDQSGSGKLTDDSENEENLSYKESASECSEGESDFESNSDESKEESDSNMDKSFDVSNPLRRNREAFGIKTMSDVNHREELEKANCTREQLKLWENILEMRIKLQKCLVNSNKMPQHNTFKNYNSNDEFKKNCDAAKNKLTNLLSNLIKLQSNLTNNFSETRGILRKNKKRKSGEDEETVNKDDLMEEEIPSDTEDEEENEKCPVGEGSKEDLEKSENKNENEEPTKKKMKLSDFEKLISHNHTAYSEYRNSVIQKWNEKTRIASGVIAKGVNQPVIKQIEFTLANKDKLYKKTQLKRSEYEIIGKSTSEVETDGRRSQEYDTEIYDDDDFYHQLLRELIEHKSADVTDPVQLSKQWIQLQNMRNKMKRKIDTRATKGRRLRYTVHQKLVNFMAPITANDTWTSHAKDELYSSLFGKIKNST